MTSGTVNHNDLRDVRLFRAIQVLERERVEVLSLDVFDTLLWRCVAEPVDAFVLLASHLQRAHLLDDSVNPLAFARLREAAEARARRAHPNPTAPEVSIEEIYDAFPRSLRGEASAASFAAAEVDLERYITSPDVEVAEFARIAQQKYGLRVVLVSDTYFSEDQLGQLVDRPSFDGLAIERIFTSSAHRTGKGQRLFEVVLSTLEVAPSSVLHVGDHPESDVAAPERAGIRAVHFPRINDELRQVLDRETLLRQAHPYQRISAVDPVHGDFGLTALRTKAANRGRPDASMTRYWQFGASVLGPTFTAFAEWVHGRTRALGAERVFAVMREGDFLARLVNGASPAVDDPVRATTISLSRRVTAGAVIEKADEKELREFLWRRKPPSVREFLESVGVSPAQAPELADRADTALDDGPTLAAVLDAFASREDLRATAIAHSATLRQRLVESFLKTTGATSGDTVILLDLGWGGTIQWYLQRALDIAGIDVELRGLYLLTTDAAIDRMLDGTHAEGFLASAGMPMPVSRWVTRSPEILEQVCMADVGSVIGFEPDGTPLLDSSLMSPAQALQRNAIQQGILGFQGEWNRYRDVLPPERRCITKATDLLTAMLLRFVLEPTTNEAAMFESWMHDENFGAAAEEAVVTTDLTPVLRHFTPREILDLPMQRVYWPFGLAALHDRTLAEQVSAAAMGLVDLSAFESPVTLPVRVHVDGGGGFEEVHRVEVPTNVHGLSLVRADIARPTRSVKLLFSDEPVIVRVDRLRLTAARRGKSERAVLELEWPDSFSRIRVDRCARLAPNLLVGAAQGPVLWIDLPGDWGDVYRFDVEVAFAALRTPPLQPSTAATAEVVVDVMRRVKARAAGAWRTAERSAALRSGFHV